MLSNFEGMRLRVTYSKVFDPANLADLGGKGPVPADLATTASVLCRPTALGSRNLACSYVLSTMALRKGHPANGDSRPPATV